MQGILFVCLTVLDKNKGSVLPLLTCLILTNLLIQKAWVMIYWFIELHAQQTSSVNWTASKFWGMNKY